MKSTVDGDKGATKEVREEKYTGKIIVVFKKGNDMEKLVAKDDDDNNL